MTRSDAPALERLREHLFRLTGRIIEEVESGLHSGSPEAVAMSRENTLRAVLSRFFPPTYELAKGKMYDLYDCVSDSLDVVVLAPNHPKLKNERGEIEILLADGVQCAIELKPDLRDLPTDFGRTRQQAPEINRALEQIRSVKRLRRESIGLLKMDRKSAEYSDNAHRIPTHLVTAKGDPKALCQYIANYYVAHAVPVLEQVDMILVLGNALIVNTKAPEHGFVPQDAAWMSTIVALDFQKDALAAFVVRMLAEVGPELLLSDPVLRRYLTRIPSPAILVGCPNTAEGQLAWAGREFARTTGKAPAPESS